MMRPSEAIKPKQIQKKPSIDDTKKKSIPKKSGNEGMNDGDPFGPVRILTEPQQKAMTTDEKNQLKMNIGKLTLE